MTADAATDRLAWALGIIGATALVAILLAALAVVAVL